MEKKGKLDYFYRNEANRRMSEIRNGRKKAEITYYLDTSLKMVPKIYEHQYCSKNAATPGATNFILST